MEKRTRTVPDPSAKRSPGRVLLDAASETVIGAAFFVLGFLAWCLQWSVALVAFLLVMAGAGLYVFMVALDGGEYVTVPNIVGLSISEASAEVLKNGLEMGNVANNLVPHPTVPKDHVIYQRPEAGRVVRTGRTVMPTVSLGEDSLATPSLLGLSLDEARQQIAQSRFRSGSVARVPHEATRDTVLAQDPPPGHRVPNQSEIHLLASAGSEQGRDLMPDIQDKTLDEAKQILEQFGLIANPKPVDLPGARMDVVLSQDPQPDEIIARGDVVTYEYKPSGEVEAQSDVHKVEILHPMPYDWYDKEVRVVRTDSRGSAPPTTYKAAFDEASMAQRRAGGQIKIRDEVASGGSIQVFVDGTLMRTYNIGEDGSVSY